MIVISKIYKTNRIYLEMQNIIIDNKFINISISASLLKPKVLSHYRVDGKVAALLIQASWRSAPVYLAKGANLYVDKNINVHIR